LTPTNRNITKALAELQQMTKHLITFLSSQRVGICLLCKIAVQPGDGAESHFRGLHKVKGPELDALKTLCQLWDIQSPKTVEIPQHGSPPIDVLPIHLGFKCHACMFLSRSQGTVTQHYRKEHGQSSGERWKKVSLQAFKLNGPGVRFWMVNHT
jgi:hypothetical protein